MPDIRLAEPAANRVTLLNAIRRVAPIALPAVALALAYRAVLPPIVGFLALAAVILAVFWALREQIHSVMLAFLLVVFAATVFGQRPPKVAATGPAGVDAGALIARWRNSGGFNERLPIVIHLVFDEMASPSAMTDDLPGGSDTRRWLHALGEANGFRTYEAVYGRDFYSGTALPNLFGVDYRQSAPSQSRDSRLHAAVAVNGYFEDMAARGYRTIVFQTPHLDFCASREVDACETFDSFNPGEAGFEGLDLRSRVLTLSRTLLRAYEPSYTTRYGLMLLEGMSELGLEQAAALGARDRYDVQRFPAWFDRFRSFVAGVPRGTHIFAHFMVPHSPYLLTEECGVRGRLDSGYYLASRFPDPAEREAARVRYYSLYLSQVRCIGGKIAELMTELTKLDRFADARILIHGDHGSRISAGNVLEDCGPRDFIDNYATYFAVKAPGFEPGLDCRFLSLAQAFREFTTDSYAKLSKSPEPVMVNSRLRGEIVPTDMPRFGCAPTTSNLASSGRVEER